jgi:hypothetical protein
MAHIIAMRREKINIRVTKAIELLTIILRKRNISLT